MKIQETIEIVEELLRHSSSVFSADEFKAVEISVEALRYKKLSSGGHYFPPYYLLLGETKD